MKPLLKAFSSLCMPLSRILQHCFHEIATILHADNQFPSKRKTLQIHLRESHGHLVFPPVRDRLHNPVQGANIQKSHNIAH